MAAPSLEQLRALLGPLRTPAAPPTWRADVWPPPPVTPSTPGHGAKLDANPVPVDVYRVEHPASKRCAAALDEHGYMLSRYRAIEVVVGKSGLQLAFDPRTAELIDRMPCALLQQVVEAPLDRARDITGGSW